MPFHHGDQPRKFAPADETAIIVAPKRANQWGLFGRLFEDQCPEGKQPPPHEFGLAMHRRVGSFPDTTELDGTNPEIPAGYVFLGQFLAHDISFDTTSIREQTQDKRATQNYRTPLLDLDALYGGGPLQSPSIYDRYDYGRFLLGPTATLQFDVPRNGDGQALIPDPRNDQNVVVSQLHFAILRFHNRVLERVAEFHPAAEKAQRFAMARDQVIRHYHRIITHEYLDKVCNPKVLSVIRANLPKRGSGKDVGDTFQLFQYSGEPFLPVEFAMAAFRFGHSQLSDYYRINASFRAPLFSPQWPEVDDLRGQRPLPASRRVDWCYFFDLGRVGIAASSRLQHSRRISASVARSFRELPKEILGDGGGVDGRILAKRDLRRGIHWKLACIQEIRESKVYKEKLATTFEKNGFALLADDEIWPAGEFKELTADGRTHAPLWYYILREAELRENGKRLGPLGSWIVAETILGLVDGAKISPWSAEEHGWLTEGERGPDRANFTMANLLKVAGVADFELAEETDAAGPYLRPWETL